MAAPAPNTKQPSEFAAVIPRFFLTNAKRAIGGTQKTKRKKIRSDVEN